MSIWLARNELFTTRYNGAIDSLTIDSRVSLIVRSLRLYAAKYVHLCCAEVAINKNYLR